MGHSAPSVLSGMSAAGSNGKKPFVPRAVANFEETGLSHALIESLVLKFLMNAGTATGRRIAAELGLPFGPFPDFLRQLKNQQIVTYANSAAANDYVYSLTDTGRMRASSTSTSARTPAPRRCRSTITWSRSPRRRSRPSIRRRPTFARRSPTC